MSYPESGVGEHVQEVGIAMSKGDLQPVVGQHVNAFDIAQLSLEVGRGADAVSRQAAGVDEVKPELGVLRSKWSAVMPVNVVPDGERPLGEARTCNPLGGQVGAYDVHILTAPHHQVAGTEERAGDVVKGYAAGA